jgi:thioredoxin-like negative regulator of GroEL
VNDLLGGGPWGLCDIAVVEPPKAVPMPVPTPTPPPPTTEVKASPFKAETLASIADVELKAALDECRTGADRDRLIDVTRQRFQWALEKDPKNKAALLGLAKLYTFVSDKERAVATYQQVAEHHPKDAEVMHAAMRSMALFEDWPAAVTAAEKALELDPESRTYRKALGMCLAKGDRWEEAFDQLRRVMSEADARCFVGRMLIDADRMGEAKAQFAAALRGDPNHQQAKALLAEVQDAEKPIRPVEDRHPPK